MHWLRRGSFCAVIAFLLTSSLPALGQVSADALTDITSSFEISTSRLIHNRRTGETSFTVTLQNTSESEFENLFLAVEGIPLGVPLNGALGEFEGTPFVAIPESVPAQGTTSFRIGFANPNRLRLRVDFRVLEESLPDTPLPISISSPPNLSLFNTPSIQVTGETEAGAEVTVNGVDAGTGPDFSATIQLDEGSNTITAVAQAADGRTGTASIQVGLDRLSPAVEILSPADGSTVTSETVSVSGLINDVVVGTVNAGQASVTVNGAPAIVSNRSFYLEGLVLNPGANTITATGSDRAGNQRTSTIEVMRALPPPGQSTLMILGGNNQTGTIGQDLPEALSVLVKNAAGDPQAGQSVVFKILRGDGTLTAGSEQARSIVTLSDQNGVAQVLFRLGSRAGAGNNLVAASAAGVFGQPIFSATALAGAPAKINVDSGSMQTGIVGERLPLPLVSVVTDEGHNRLAGVPVTFDIARGGGNIGGQQSLVVLSDSDGRALAELTLGPDEGVENNLVRASFPGNPGSSATFTASALVPGDPADTRVSGLVLDNSNVPIPGVTVSIPGTGLQAVTDAQGQFELAPAPVGLVHLHVDGTTTPRPGTWPELEFELVTVPGRNNDVGMPIYLLLLNPRDGCVDETTGATVTLGQIPGFKLEIAPGSATFTNGSKAGCVGVSIVHTDKVPMVPNFGQQPRVIVTIQPPGVFFDPPAALTLPNVDGLPAGQQTEMYSFDHDLGQFVSIGTGTVSDDGLVVASDPGVGVVKAGWHGAGPPNDTGCACDCPTCQRCEDGDCVANDEEDPGPCEACRNGEVVELDEPEDEPCRRCENGEVTLKPDGPIVDQGQKLCCLDGTPLPNNPIADLDLCPNKVANPNYVPFSNGCGGGPGILPNLQPDDPMLIFYVASRNHPLAAEFFLYHFGGAPFTPPCDGHDICYGTCNAPKDTCDGNFLAGMQLICATEYSGTNPSEPTFRAQCLGYAMNYFTLVQSFDYFYDSAQIEACNCCQP